MFTSSTDIFYVVLPQKRGKLGYNTHLYARKHSNGNIYINKNNIYKRRFCRWIKSQISKTKLSLYLKKKLYNLISIRCHVYPKWFFNLMYFNDFYFNTKCVQFKESLSYIVHCCWWQYMHFGYFTFTLILQTLQKNGQKH